MSETWTVRKVLTWTSGHFTRSGVDSPRLTAEVLLAHTLATDRVHLYIDLDRPLRPPELASFRGLVERRASGEPTQYLTGQKEFYNRPFSVDPRVFIPRPETELLVEAVLQNLPTDTPARVLDLCTGSGCIAITVAAERLKASVLAIDLSPDACAVARSNAEALGVGSRVTVREGDLFAPIPAGSTFDAVISNPPYIKTAEMPDLPPEVCREPRLALEGGADGLSVIARIVRDGQRWLKPGGLLAMELGESEGDPILNLLKEAGYEAPRIQVDLARQDRLAFARRPAAG